MGRTCRGICVLHKGSKIPNGHIYKFGNKRCSFCCIFMHTKNIRCPCCKAILRTKARNNRKESFSNPEKMMMSEGGFRDFG